MESVSGLKQRKQVLKPVKTHVAFLERDKGASAVAEEEEELLLSPSARLFHEPNFNVYIIAVMGCKTRIQPDIIKPNLKHTLLKHPRFSSLQVDVDGDGKKMKWVRTKVDLDKHLIVPDIDMKNTESPDKFVEDYVSDLTKTTIDKSQPLWDLHLLNVRTSDAEAIGVFRIHHSLGDGTSLMSLLLACTRQIADPEALPTIPVGKQKHSNGNKRAWVFWRVLVAFWWVIRLVWNTAVDVLGFIITAIWLKDTETPIKGPPSVEATPRRFVWRTVSLDDLKLVKNELHATINDAALGITQAGLSRYLNRRYGEEWKLKGLIEAKNNLPEKMRLRSTLLINIRPSAGIQALADMMEKDTKAKWGNWIGYVLLPFTIAIKDDPLDYVREAKAIIDRKKLSLEAIYTFSIAEIVLKLFGIKISSALSHRIISHTTLCFSNLVGPQEEIGFYGHPMAFLAPSSFNQPHGLMINFQSYVNKMTIVLSVDESTVPDPHQLMDDIVHSLAIIKEAAVASHSSKR